MGILQHLRCLWGDKICTYIDKCIIYWYTLFQKSGGKRLVFDV